MVKPFGQAGDNTRTRILDAADIVFVRRGVDGARTVEIAELAGVNKSLLHYYFRSKAGLARAVWQRIASDFVPGIFQMLASDLSLEDKVDQFVASYHQMLSRHPYLLSYVLSEAARHPDLATEFYTAEKQQAARQTIERLQQQIDAQVEAGRMAPISADQFFVSLVGSCLFPFAARPILTEVLGLGPEQFEAFISARRQELPMQLKRILTR